MERRQQHSSSLGLQCRFGGADNPQGPLLAAAHDALQELEDLPEFHLSVDHSRSPRLYLFKARAQEKCILGIHHFTIFDDETENSKARLISGKTIILKDNICIGNVPQDNGTD